MPGRCADPSLYIGPLAHEFGWDLSDPDIVGKGTVFGHLLECAGQLTGGYFVDPLIKPVEAWPASASPAQRSTRTVRRC